MADSDVELAIMRLAWRLDALDKWREEISELVAGNRRELDRLVKADEIAEQVADRLRHERTLHLTIVQKALITVVTVVGLAGSIKALIPF